MLVLKPTLHELQLQAKGLVEDATWDDCHVLVETDYNEAFRGMSEFQDTLALPELVVEGVSRHGVCAAMPIAEAMAALRIAVKMRDAAVIAAKMQELLGKPKLEKPGQLVSQKSGPACWSVSCSTTRL